MSAEPPIPRIFPLLLGLVLLSAGLAGCAEKEMEESNIGLGFRFENGPYFLQVLHPYGNPYRGMKDHGMWVGLVPGPGHGGFVIQECYPYDPDFWMQLTVRKAPDAPVLFNATWHHLDCYRYRLQIDAQGQATLSRLMGPDAGKPIPYQT